jgi:hypothetical protein
MSADQLWARTDPLGEALHLLRMSGTCYFRSELSQPWGLGIPAMPDCLWFHVVTSGRALLEVDGDARRWLHPGELALVPHGTGHRLRDPADAPAPSVLGIPHEFVTDRYAIIRHGGGGAGTTLIWAPSASPIPRPARCSHCCRPPSTWSIRARSGCPARCG